MQPNAWVKEFPGSVITCDPQGIILEMNDVAAAAYTAEGGLGLIGSNVLDCHPEPSRSQLQKMMETQQSHIYSIVENGVLELVYQCPWHKDGVYAGFLEIILPLPPDIKLAKLA